MSPPSLVCGIVRDKGPTGAGDMFREVIRPRCNVWVGTSNGEVAAASWLFRIASGGLALLELGEGAGPVLVEQP